MTSNFSWRRQSFALPVTPNRTCRTKHYDCPMGSFELRLNSETNLIFNNEFDESAIVYDANYHNEQGHSLTFNKHLAEVETLLERYSSKGDSLVEVGCGKGYFLTKLIASGYFNVSGFDTSLQKSVNEHNFKISSLKRVADLFGCCGEVTC